MKLEKGWGGSGLGETGGRITVGEYYLNALYSCVKLPKDEFLIFFKGEIEIKEEIPMSAASHHT